MTSSPNRLARTPGAHRKHRLSPLGSLVGPIAFVVIGVLLFLYPVVATKTNNVQGLKVARSYHAMINQTPAETLSAEIARAEDYNLTHTAGPVLDPWLSRVAADNTAYQEYLHILGDGGPSPMSRVIVPGANIDLPVYHGSDEFVLQRGVGHLFGSSLPIGGPSTHAVLTGHTGLTNASMFDNLINVTKGDEFFVSTYGRDMKYVVDDIRVVTPEETRGLGVQEGKDLVTLVTCTPYGINTHRLIVTGHRVPVDDAAAAQAVAEASTSTWQWWMFAGLGAAAIFLLVVARWLREAIAARKRNNAPAASGA